MKTILRIAKTELRTLFYSPIAWFLMIVFLIQCGVIYLGVLEAITREQDAGGKFFGSVIEYVFLSNQGLFGVVLRNLYLYIPLLTMGLISREISSGTIRLLYSSPIRVREIVLGKFLAMMIYSLLLVGILAIFIVSSLYQVVSPDTGMLMSALLGIYLLLCAYSAIGLFMSCLTTYQVVAAVCTFVMIGLLSYVGTLWQDIAFVRNLTYFLSISGRTGKMLTGLITSKDVIYFLAIVYLFLGLSIYKIKAGMESRPAMIKVGRYALVVVSTLVIGYFSSIPSLVGYYDATRAKARTLTPNAQKIIKELGDEPLEVTAYNNLMGRYWDLGSPDSYNRNLARWEPYTRFKHNIELKTVLYYDSAYDNPGMFRFYPGKTLAQVAKQYADSKDLSMDQFKTPAEIRKVVDLRPELNRYVMQLKYKGRTTFLRVFDDNMQWPGETEVSAAFKRLLHARMPKIIFLSGHLERNINKMGDREYKVLTNLTTFRNSLLNQGFDVDTLSLDTQQIPTDISALVLADPKVALTATDIEKLQQYVNNGGNLLVAGEPGKQAILNPFLRQLGVQLMDGILVQTSKDLQPELVTPYLTATAASFYPALVHAHHDSAMVSMPRATALSFTDTGAFTIKPLLTTNVKTCWLKKDNLVTDSAEVVFSPENGDERKPFATAVALTRKVNNKEQRIIVTGDADFMGNAELQRFNMRAANFVFNTALFSWLSYGEFPIDSTRPKPEDTAVLLTKGQVKFLRIIYVWVLPGLLLAFGAILLIRRKRK
ncbi:Gldg family protein [Chitinophaga sp. 212800008-4]|uniref:Gldg family protein n=1 Tax=unclassified Chitinophaga TaxID=2619133 RepID=UPI0030D24AF4